MNLKLKKQLLLYELYCYININIVVLFLFNFLKEGRNSIRKINVIRGNQ